MAFARSSLEALLVRWASDALVGRELVLEYGGVEMRERFLVPLPTRDVNALPRSRKRSAERRTDVPDKKLENGPLAPDFKLAEGKRVASVHVLDRVIHDALELPLAPSDLVVEYAFQYSVRLRDPRHRLADPFSEIFNSCFAIVTPAVARGQTVIHATPVALVLAVRKADQN
eukprot:5570754-Prymnesium_polylepis.1